MTYAAYEASTSSGAPVECYEFIQGLSKWYFTTGTQEFTSLARTFIPSPVKRDRIKQGEDALKETLTLTFPRGDEFAAQFLGFAPDLVTTLNVYRLHLTDPDKELAQYWKGRVAGAKASDNTVQVECESVFTSIKRPGLRAKFELSCRHTLYTRGCNVNQEAYLLTGSLLSVSGGVTLTVQGAGAFPGGYFTGGMVVAPDFSSRFIVAHSSDQITISRPFNALVGGADLRLYPGCDHLRTTCNTKFNNLDNFGGFPWIPIKNPFALSSIV